MSKVMKVKGIQFDQNRFGFICALSRRESGSDLRQNDHYKVPNIANNVDAKTVENSYGYLGYFQFGLSALQEIGYKDRKGNWTGVDGAKSKESFLASREIQLKAVNRLINSNCRLLRNNNINEYYGKTINGVELTESGVIAGCHLVGLGGLAAFLDVPKNLKFKKDKDGNITSKKHSQFDGNNVHISEYIKLFNHYDLESCCNRKIRVGLKNDNKPLANVEVTIKSSYQGKLQKQPISVKHVTNEEGNLPVIVRHPDAKIVLVIQNKESEEIIQLADKTQSKIINVSGNVIASAPLASASQPQAKPQANKTPQEQREESKPKVVEKTEQPKSQNQDVKFNIRIVEGDTGKAITNMRFLLTYKGNVKQHISDNSGVKTGIIAEVGRDIELSVAGEKGNQVIGHFITQASHQGQTISIKLPVQSFKLIISKNGKIVPNALFSIFYRGREIPKRTNAKGEIHTKMLVGFVYGFGVENKALIKLRVIKSVISRNITVNEKVIEASSLYESIKVGVRRILDGVVRFNLAKLNPELKNIIEKVIENSIVKVDKKAATQQNTHTQSIGNPLTIVSNQPTASSDTCRFHIYSNGKIKLENRAATGFAEFIYYDEKGGTHNLGKSAFIKAPTWISNTKKDKGTTYLVDYKYHANYKKGNIGYSWEIKSNEHRYYLSGLGLAAVLGAMCKFGYMQYVGSGFSLRDGSSGKVSKSHINGVNGDFRYFGKNNSHVPNAILTSDANFDWDNNVKFVKLLYLFGYKKFMSWSVSNHNNELLPYSSQYQGHKNHLHLQGFKPNVENF